MPYILAALCFASLGVILYLAISNRRDRTDARAAMAAERIAGMEQLKAERNQIEAERLRDEAIVKAATAQAATDRAIAQLAATQDQRNIAVAKLADALRKDIIGMSDADAIAAINAELGL